MTAPDTSTSSRSVTGSFTPREIVSELDRYIIGQHKAKRAVAIALRNRWRRQHVAPELRDEIAPKNIIMIGSTGVGKTEIARRLAKLARAPFIKVEASKFTEVGYIGRDVESIIRDLTETAVQMVQKEALEQVKTRAAEHAEDRLVQLLAEEEAPIEGELEEDDSETLHDQAKAAPQFMGPFVINAKRTAGQTQQARPVISPETLDDIRKRLRAGELDDAMVELDVADNAMPTMTVMGMHGMEDMEMQMRDMLSQLPGFKNRTKQRKVKVPEARSLLEQQEAGKLIDMDEVQRNAIQRVEQMGIVFLDEIDKVAGKSKSSTGPDVSREGVQRDLLPIVEGSTVNTKYGMVKSDHILFIAAGAFHVAEVSDLIPELQGRFPIRVELESLTQDDFVSILTEPKNALIKQYQALLATEKVTLTFEDSAIQALARYAAEVNENNENIGARRLHSILEALLEELSFTAPERNESSVTIDAAYVQDKLQPILNQEDLARYVL